MKWKCMYGKYVNVNSILCGFKIPNSFRFEVSLIRQNKQMVDAKCGQ